MPIIFFSVRLKQATSHFAGGSFHDDEMDEMNALVESNAMILVNIYI